MTQRYWHARQDADARAIEAGHDPRDVLGWDTQEVTQREAVAQHVYDGERCQFCGSNMYDVALYGPEFCIDRPALIYTTETEEAP